MSNKLESSNGKKVFRIADSGILPIGDGVSLGSFTSMAGKVCATDHHVGAEDTSLKYNAGDIDIHTPAGKTIELQTPVYADLQFPVSAGKVPAANFPDYEAFTTNTREYGFAVDEYMDLSANEVPHSWVEGGIAEVHAHITLKAANDTGSDRFAKFTAYVAYANDGAVWAETPATAELTIPTGSTALKRFYLHLGNIDLSGHTIGTMLKITIKRIAAAGGTEYSGNIFLNQIGVHLLHDTLGSRALATK